MASAVAAPQTESDRVRNQVLKALDAAAGQIVSDDDLLYTGDKMILPVQYQGNLKGAINALTERMKGEEQEFSFRREYPYRPYDGAAAFHRAIIRTTGMTPKGITQKTFFGDIPPEFVSAKSGPGETVQVPWGEFHVAMLDATFELDATKASDGGYNFVLNVQSKQKHRKRIDAILMVVEDELKERSLYRGKAVSGDDGIELDFFDPNTLDPAKIIYTAQVMEQLEANVWTPMRYPQTLRDMGVPLRRAILLEGPNGTGKTSAGVLTAQVALQHGWTFIRVASGEDPMRALGLARRYTPAVVWYEDIDDMTAGKSRAAVSKLNDVLDNVQSKNAEVIAVFTSNFPEKIEKAVLRPGRIDSVIHVGPLDADAKRRLITALVPAGMLDANIDWGKVTEACRGEDETDSKGNVLVRGEDYLPAFLTEATQRAMRYAVARAAGGRPKNISTSDLVLAAEGLRPQLALWLAAESIGRGERPTLEVALAEAVRPVVGETLRAHTMVGHPFVESNGRH